MTPDATGRTTAERPIEPEANATKGPAGDADSENGRSASPPLDRAIGTETAVSGGREAPSGRRDDSSDGRDALPGGGGASDGGYRPGVRHRSRYAPFLVGVDPRRAAATGVALAVLAAMHLVSFTAAGVDFGENVQRLAPPSDAATAIVIAIGLLAVVLGPLLVGWTTASPFLAYLVAQVPWLVGVAMATGWALDVDVTVSLTTGAGGCALALYRGESARTGSSRPWRVRNPPGWVVLPTAVLVVVSLSLVTKFVALAPDSMVLAAAPFSIYWLLVAGVSIPFATTFVSEADSPTES